MNNDGRGYFSSAKDNHFAFNPAKPVENHRVLLESHLLLIGYAMWLFGFLGAHRFYFGRPISGAIWFFTFGLLGIGWLIDLFLIPEMKRSAERRFQSGPLDYSLGWILFIFLGIFGVHRFYQGKIWTGLVFLLTGGVFGIGLIYDLLTLNEQMSEMNQSRLQTYNAGIFNF